MELRMEALGLIEPRSKKPAEAAPSTTTNLAQSATSIAGTPGATQGFESAAEVVDDTLPVKAATGTTGGTSMPEQLEGTQAEKSVVESMKVSVAVDEAEKPAAATDGGA